MLRKSGFFGDQTCLLRCAAAIIEAGLISLLVKGSAPGRAWEIVCAHLWGRAHFLTFGLPTEKFALQSSPAHHFWKSQRSIHISKMVWPTAESGPLFPAYMTVDSALLSGVLAFILLTEDNVSFATEFAHL